MNPNQPCGLEEVIINAELWHRPARSPDPGALNTALIELARTLAHSPDKILQRLVETALRLCRADTAGISLLDEKDGKEVFRWEALAGVFSDRLNNTMPRNASPCGTTIDRNATQLMYMAERVFPALKSQPPIVEALLIPFHVEGRPVGTVWVVAHDEHRKFDREDEQIVKTLAEFASASWQLWKARADTEAAAQKERQRISALDASNKALKAHIAKRVMVEQQLQQLNRELQKLIAEKTTELTRANADLVRSIEKGKDSDRQLQKSQGIDDLTAGIAHDLNNILNVIQGYAALIMSHPEEAASVVEDAEVITTTVGEAVELARHLLPGGGQRPEVKCEPIDVNDELNRLSKTLRRTFPPAIEVSLDLDSRVPKLAIQPGRINQAILNLCINARDAIVNRGTITMQTCVIGGDLLRRRFPEAVEDRYACISVSDTGVGMEPNIKNRIFDAGFTTKEQSGGTGLGLSMVNSIVADHHGFVEATSEPGRGAIFTIYLPISEAAGKAVSSSVPENTASRLSPPTILFAEDETRLTEVMQRSLERAGLKVLTAKDGDEAIQLHDRHKHEIAIAILDSGLAKINGWEAFQQMKKSNPSLKAILASGYISAEAEARLGKGELAGVLQKPYRGDEVLAMIKRTIDVP